MIKKEVYEKAIAQYGNILQKIVACEEINELTFEIAMLKLQKTIMKTLRGYDREVEVAEEMADVEIVLEQMKMIFKNKELVEKIKKAKIKRLENILEKH